MIAYAINAERPKLLERLMAARDWELSRASLRPQILEFVSGCIVLEIDGSRLAAEGNLEAFAAGLMILDREYRQPRILRALAEYARAGVAP